MVDEHDIRKAAEGLLRNHGERAAIESAEMALRWAKRGDEEAASVWWRVKQAVDALQRARMN